MKLNYKITINATVPEKEIKNALSDEENCIALKELLLDELPKELEDLVVNVEKTEQHEAEIRKPLEDEIERLCRLCDKLNNDYFQQKEISDYGMKELNIAIRQLKQERQEVIAELEEWVEENSHEVTASSVGGFDYYVNDTEELKQKLNEMKGGAR